MIHTISKAPASNSDNYIFYTSDVEPQDPYIDLQVSGVRTWYDEPGGNRLNFFIEVHDAQGVPGNIESVTVTFPNGTDTEVPYPGLDEALAQADKQLGHRLIVEGETVDGEINGPESKLRIRKLSLGYRSFTERGAALFQTGGRGIPGHGH